MKKLSITLCMAAMLTASCTGARAQADPETSTADTVTSKVYMLTDITPENLVKIYDALGREAKGKVAVKISTGEPGGNNFLSPDLIKTLVEKSTAPSWSANTA